MKSLTAFSSFLVLLIFVLSLVSCSAGTGDDLRESEKPTLTVSRELEPFISGLDGRVIAVDGEQYRDGELKPVWKRLSDKFGVDFAVSDDPDLIFDEVCAIASRAELSEILDLSNYFALMPDLREYNYQNPLLLGAIASDGKGAAYVPTPFDFCEPSILLFVHEPTVRLILDGSPNTPDSEILCNAVYEPTDTYTADYSVGILSDDGSTASLDYLGDYGGDLIERMNGAIESRMLTAEYALEILRQHIDGAYGGFYGERRSDLFIGNKAAANTDELIALLRIAMLYSSEISVTPAVAVKNEDGLHALGSSLFGTRGVVGCGESIYYGDGGDLTDARVEESTYSAYLKLAELKDEGLISLRDGNCLLRVATSDESLSNFGDDYVPIPLPIIRCDGEDEPQYLRFDESSSAVDTSLAVNYRVGNDAEKLSAVLSIINYLYTEEGRELFSFGGCDARDLGVASQINELSGGDGLAFLRDFVGAARIICPLEARAFGASDKALAQLQGICNSYEKGLTRRTDFDLDTPDRFTEIVPSLTLTDNEWTRITAECGNIAYFGDLCAKELRKRLYTIVRDFDSAGALVELRSLHGTFMAQNFGRYLYYKEAELERRIIFTEVMRGGES